MTATPISEYGLISDCQSAALVSRAGSIDWLCWPRFDSPAVFGRVLDDNAGHWMIAPVEASRGERTYVDGAMVLTTTFVTDAGEVTVTDALVFDLHARGHEIGKRAPNVLVRVIRGLRGRVELAAEFAPRLEYGKVRPRLRWEDDSLLTGGGATVLRLAGPRPVELDGGTARWRFGVDEGERVAFALHYSTTSAFSVDAWPAPEIVHRLEDTIDGWQSWSEDHVGYDGPWTDSVRLGGRVLQALTFAPTGAVVAAPTTSLPEDPGGSRNWDYRFSWLRDASLTMNALWVAACPDEAHRFFQWILNASGSSTDAGGLQVVYGVGGEHDLTERELEHLHGWAGSRPVRVGNDAWRQQQNDIYGEILDAAWCLRDQLEPFGDIESQFLIELADRAADVWADPDFGIWEARTAPRHFLYSKLMCWVALDRAVSLAGRIGADDRVDEWTTTREQIRNEIIEHGWNEDVGAYTQAFGAAELDASALMLAITGFHDAGHERMVATIEAIASSLTDDAGLVYRYRAVDGLDGDEATFAICSFWLVECFALGGEVDRATKLFETVLSYANDVGLLSEQLGGEPGVLLGNFPQAFSHIGLINAAQAIGRARELVRKRARK